MSAVPLLLLFALAPRARAATCYSIYYGNYECNGLSSGARIGIGIGVAVLIIGLVALFSFMRRKRLQKAWIAHQNAQPPLPPQNQSYPSYPPPNSYPQQNAQGYSNSNWNGHGNNMQQYAAPPGAPPAAYQPSMAGQYGGHGGEGGEHGYEYQQHQENLRREEEERRAGGNAPPGYDVTPQATGGSTHYAPPSGPPPGKAHGAV